MTLIYLIILGIGLKLDISISLISGITSGIGAAVDDRPHCSTTDRLSIATREPGHRQKIRYYRHDFPAMLAIGFIFWYLVGLIRFAARARKLAFKRMATYFPLKADGRLFFLAARGSGPRSLKKYAKNTPA